MSVAEGWRRPLRSYLPQSILATVVVVAAPLLVLWLSTSVLSLEIPTLAILLMALSAAFLVAGVGSEIWRGREGAREISFSELLLWSWYRLQRADRRLAAGHRRISEIKASPEEQLAVLRELSAALESKDPYTKGHSARVERHSFNIAVALGLSLKDIETLRKAASLHDVGKIRIPNRILHKPGKLDERERALIEEHSILGAWMVGSLGDEQIVQTVRHHHERWDGAGYPDGLRGNDIPLFARIIAVADTFDAITSTRSYRAGGSRNRGIDIIRAESGSQLDPVVVEAFLTTLPARSPLVAALALLAAPQIVWREVLRWLQRFGSGAAAPAVGAVGAAVVLGAASFVAPGAGRDHVPAPPVAAAAPSREGRAAPSVGAERSAPGTDMVLGKRIHKKSRPKTVRQRRANDEPVRSTSKTRDVPAEASAPVTAAPPPSNSTTEPEARREDKAEAPEEPEEPEAPEAPEDKAEPEAPSPDADALDEVDDPKADKGSD